MIRLRLNDLMWERRFTITELHRVTGISRQRLGALRNSPELQYGIQFGTLDRLCTALECGAGDILEYVPEE